jgi:hypothetical protein
MEKEEFFVGAVRLYLEVETSYIFTVSLVVGMGKSADFLMVILGLKLSATMRRARRIMRMMIKTTPPIASPFFRLVISAQSCATLPLAGLSLASSVDPSGFWPSCGCG